MRSWFRNGGFRLGGLAVSMTLCLCVATPRAQAPQPAPGVPGPEHGVLTALLGTWDVYLADARAGAATVVARLDGRYVELDIKTETGPIRHALYTLGFDRRHDEYTIVAMDDTGTYWVTARGAREGARIPMYGTDEDPVMRSMGLDKEFAFVLHLASPDRLAIEIRYVDTRTLERTEMSFLTFDLRRAGESTTREGA